MSTMSILDRREGDARITWDVNRPDEVSAARLMFAEMKNRGYLAYALDESGSRGEVLRTFDPAAERIVMSPPTVGG